ncbi:molybdopterin dinucleotide binding domain-containing protein [Paenibacillus rubinfantis]|uniref:molybdopterin dinucleotide binding domain-containing protein n=1 Tax=Paenibacillus rubinfantis TaxID=1720296 RepID=UPI001E503D19|nr:molybdopterin dinucleotide binding domain-containing protein [Paenibacillus rubinfantis]
MPRARPDPDLAEQLRLREGDRVRLTSRRGSLEVAAKVTADIHPRTMFVPFHWGGDQAVNRLTNDALHPVSRMPEFKISAVRAERVAPEEANYTAVQRTDEHTGDPAALAASRHERG